MTRRAHTIDSVFVLLLFTVFALSVFAVLVFGTRSYISVNNSANDGYDLRTCLSYIETKVRQSDADGAISVGEMGGSSALLIDRDIDGEIYETALYACDGKMRELFSEKSLGLGADNGTELLSIKSLDFSLEDDGLLRVECTDMDGSSRSALIYISTRDGEAE